MAGSSLPVTWRRPELELKLGTKITEALVASRGELEIYGIHALEALQCMVERRFLDTDRVADRAGRQGRDVPAGRRGLEGRRRRAVVVGVARTRARPQPVAQRRRHSRELPALPATATWGNFVKGPIAFLIEYRDG